MSTDEVLESIQQQMAEVMASAHEAASGAVVSENEARAVAAVPDNTSAGAFGSRLLARNKKTFRMMESQKVDSSNQVNDCFVLFCRSAVSTEFQPASSGSFWSHPGQQQQLQQRKTKQPSGESSG